MKLGIARTNSTVGCYPPLTFLEFATFASGDIRQPVPFSSVGGSLL